MPRPTSSRLALRLESLSHAELLELAVLGCETNATVSARADTLLARHKPLPGWAVSQVLLSDDLLPHLLQLLPSPTPLVLLALLRWS